MRVLIFGTMYVNTSDKYRLMMQWAHLHGQLNPTCDLLLVDSASPDDVLIPDNVRLFQLGNNIGHLARSGKDGWGRAFCAGLQYASDEDYDYVVHIEADSLFKLPVMKFCEWMQSNGLRSLVTGTYGTKHVEYNWAETGIMFFSVPYLYNSDFIERYNWQDGASKKYPHTPEAVIWELLGDDRDVLSINNIRDDIKLLTPETVHEYDWITHTTPEVYDAFMPKVHA